ncbi:sialate O-acetylesterase [Hymenobacter sp. HMF4947]|uniref:Sialate O-acetylesterase n=1 Tax=Hymenobacter ginkgonis TaxID=2682976 RepID=A0A7K1TJZ6_9BACT|nr:sialate O-acetylesterase [Hymenobacter ginkgonis]MVN78692.1 sialate O-acetylesterase [Hymenobacter ginkgonis]
MRFLLPLFVALALLASPARATVTLPALLTDNLVLQQKTTVSLWGWAAPGEAVRVTASWPKGAAATVADAQGNWLVHLPTGKAGGPYTLTVQGSNTLTINNILLGEVWLCGGQSNMNFTISRVPSSWKTGVVNAAEVIPQANYPAIRMFTVAQKVADTPQRDVEGKWAVCSPATVGEFSAVAYFFAQEIHQKTGFPVGLIHSSWGGTPAESWTRQGVLAQDSALRPILVRYQRGLATYPADNEAYKQAKAAYDQARATDPHTALPAPVAPLNASSNKSPYKLYNGMIKPLIPYTLRGVLWYQGESNAERGYQYRTLFPALIESWRAEWHAPDMPFYFVQIAPHRTQNADIRDAQLYALRTVPHTGMAVITDWGDSVDIHPRNKQVVGHRLALWALAHDYGQRGEFAGPLYQSMQVKDGQATLRFDHANGLAALNSISLRDFTIAGPDSVFVPAQARVIGHKLVVVSSPQVPHPVAVRYGWRPVPHGNLVNAAGLPASPFRTDGWRLPTQGLR